MAARSYVNVTLPSAQPITLCGTRRHALGPVQPPSPSSPPTGFSYTYLPSAPTACTLSAVNATTGPPSPPSHRGRDPRHPTLPASRPLAKQAVARRRLIQTTQFGTSTAAVLLPPAAGATKPYRSPGR